MTVRKTYHRKLLVVQVASALTLGSLLGACGGNSDNAATPGTGPTAATIQVTADSAVVNWNEPTSIDVLANDTASHGKLSLVSVSGATHGRVSVDNGKVLYAPDKGFMGTEKLNYTAKADDGGATASTDVALTVQAQLTLKGIAKDAPLANATVSATVDGKSYTSITDTSGNYTLKIATSKPTDFLTLSAVGTGAQAQVKLTSYVGDIASIVNSADVSGVLSSSTTPSLVVTHVTTAVQVLIDRMLSNKPPANTEELKIATTQLNVNDVISLSTAIRLVADLGVALPSDVKDTLALAQSPTAVKILYATIRANKPELIATAKNGVIADLPTAANFSIDGATSKTISYRTGYSAMTVTYNADGTGNIYGRAYSGVMTWKASGTSVQIIYPTPIVFSYDPGLLVNGVRSQFGIEERTQGMRITQILGNASAGSVQYGDTGSVKWLDGPQAGQDVVGASLTTNNMTELADNLSADQGMAIDAKLFSVGNKLSICVLDLYCETGTFEVSAATQFAFLPIDYTDIRTDDIYAKQFRISIGKPNTLTWEVVGKQLNLTYADGSKERYSLLWNDTSTGEQRWAGENLSNQSQWQARVISHDTQGLKVDEAFALRNQWGLYTLKAGGVTSSTRATWEISAAGDLIINRLDAKGVKIYTISYSPIKKVGNVWWFIRATSDLFKNGVPVTTVVGRQFISIEDLK